MGPLATCSDDGQSAIETRVGGAAASNVQYQYVWSLRGDKIPVVRDTYSGGEIQTGCRIYYLTDADSNVTALVGRDGGRRACRRLRLRRLRDGNVLHVRLVEVLDGRKLVD